MHNEYNATYADCPQALLICGVFRESYEIITQDEHVNTGINNIPFIPETGLRHSGKVQIPPQCRLVCDDFSIPLYLKY